jgi:hypothetical protein
MEDVLDVQSSLHVLIVCIRVHAFSDSPKQHVVSVHCRSITW